MRIQHPNSTVSTYSSVFDRYSQNLTDTHLSHLSEELFNDFHDHTKLLTSIEPINNFKNDTCYSQYEPVNNILHMLYTQKMTLKTLKQSNFNTYLDIDNKDISYCQYWGITEEHYEIIRLLEPELIRNQTSLFQFYQYIKQLDYDFKIISTHYIPELVNLKSCNLKREEKVKVFKSFQILSQLIHSMVTNLTHIMDNKIVIKNAIVSTLLTQEFENIEKKLDSFIYGICILSSIYESEDHGDLRRYFINNGEQLVKENNIKGLMSDILPHALFVKYNLKLTEFESLFSFDLLEFPVNDAVRHCKNIESKIKKETKQYKVKLQLVKQRKRLISISLNTIISLPFIFVNAFIFLPFVMICWLIFSIKGLCSQRHY